MFRVLLCCLCSKNKCDVIYFKVPLAPPLYVAVEVTSSTQMVSLQRPTFIGYCSHHHCSPISDSPTP